MPETATQKRRPGAMSPEGGPDPIPVSVIIVTKNEERNILRCLAALDRFDEVIVVDSESTDQTAVLAQQWGASVISFRWNGEYPKKRQWCLDALSIKNDWVFFVDADEVVTPALIQEIADFDRKLAGYFIKGRYIWLGRRLKFGLKNKKLALFNRHKMAFPVIDDLRAPGMGEIEGHYQPVLRAGYAGEPIGHLKAPLDHYACEDKAAWNKRHERYAAWERFMNRYNTWPADPIPARQAMKMLFRRLPFRPFIAFFHSYVWYAGFLDGRAGLDFALSRYRYYRMIQSSEN